MVANGEPSGMDFWRVLLEAARMRRGNRPGAFEIGPATLRLEVLMRGITKEDRLRILHTTGWSEPAWWSWCRDPRRVPGPALAEILKHVATIHGRAFDPMEVYEPIQPA